MALTKFWCEFLYSFLLKHRIKAFFQSGMFYWLRTLARVSVMWDLTMFEHAPVRSPMEPNVSDFSNTLTTVMTVAVIGQAN